MAMKPSRVPLDPPGGVTWVNLTHRGGKFSYRDEGTSSGFRTEAVHVPKVIAFVIKKLEAFLKDTRAEFKKCQKLVSKSVRTQNEQFHLEIVVIL